MIANAHRTRQCKTHTPGMTPKVISGALAFLLLAAGSLWAAPPAPDPMGGVQFSYLDTAAKTVFLAGDFNGWDAAALPMTSSSDGLWTLTVSLKPGDHEYKFIADGQWVTDPDNPRQKSDPFGGSNSVVTIQDDGTPVVKAAPSSASEAKASPSTATDELKKFKVGPPAVVKGGIRFTFHEPGANEVFLAGSFNGWNASDTPLVNDGNGNWGVVKKLDQGSHEYKFVVDGNWVADPENPDTASDPYGGVNSLVTVDAKGKLVAAPPASEAPATGTILTTKMILSGRYLTRFMLSKNINNDPRYRLLRPTQSVDLNFDTKVNDLVDAYFRLRMDSSNDVILNNITGNLDEASLLVHPDKFSINAYWNKEIFTSPDPMNLVGNMDHPATIGHDHLQLGKGTAGALVEADPFGIHFQGLFTNVHNFDYYNDPRLFDNTGGDRTWLRFSHKLGPLEVGIPFWLQRELLWLNFETLVGQPSTGIPSLDEYLARTGDSSTWFETESHNYKVGLDVTLPLHNDTMSLGAEALYVDYLERFVTGNQSGQNNVNGAIDIPYDERDALMASLRWDYNPDAQTSVRLQHTYRDMNGAAPDQRTMGISFLDQAIAENKIFFTILDSPAQTTYNWTELEAAGSNADHNWQLYLYRQGLREDFAPVGRTVPGDLSRTDHTINTWYISGLWGQGTAKSYLGHGELEFGLTAQDPDLQDQDFKSYEFIGRWQRHVSRTVNAIADVRYIKYSVTTLDIDTGISTTTKPDFWSPFVGFEYQPQRNLDLVFGYGVDPVELSIDYNGRQFGRWWYRQRFLFDNPGAGLLDSEQYLSDSRVFTLRAQMKF